VGVILASSRIRKHTGIMKLLLLLLAAQIQGPFQVISQGGNVYLLPQGIVKTGPRSFSMADPSNPYREQPSSIIAPPTQSQPRQRVFPPNIQPAYRGPVVIINPYVR
jgi:hypothetical protein